MATRRVFESVCDDCDLHEIYDVNAPHSHTLSINGGPVKRLDFCRRDDVAFVDYIVKLYEERGVELPEPQEQQPVEKVAAEEPTTKKVTTAKKPKALSEAPPADKPTKISMQDKIWCPLPHEDEGGKGKVIAYKLRGHHAEKVHNLNIWVIEWGDPDNILKVPCTSHAECMKTGLRFQNEHGLKTHLFRCPLPRIDLDAGDGAKQG